MLIVQGPTELKKKNKQKTLPQNLEMSFNKNLRVLL